MSTPGTSHSSGALPPEADRQLERKKILEIIDQDIPRTPESQRKCDILRAMINQDIGRTGAEDLEFVHDVEDGSAPAISDSPTSDEPLSAAFEMGMFLKKILSVQTQVTGSQRLFRPDNLSKLRCAVQIDDGPVLGNPFSSTPGCDLRVDLDPGILVQPSVGLHFRVSKDGSDSKLDDYDNDFNLGWEPCRQVGGRWMMEKFDVIKATSSLYADISDMMFPSAIQELCTKPEDLDRLYFAIFVSNVHKSSRMRPEWARALRGDEWEVPYEMLQPMHFLGGSSYRVQLWFLNPHSTIERLYHGCLAPLCYAVKYHTSPYVQFFDCEEAIGATDEEAVGATDEEAIGPTDEEAIGPTDAETIPMSKDQDGLRAKYSQLISDRSSLQRLVQDQNEKIRELADELRQSRKESDAIIQAAQGIKHHKDLKPSELKKALNAIAKLLR